MRIPEIPICQKYNLSVYEAAAYFNLGEKKLRQMIAEHPDTFSFESGHRVLIIRHKFEEFLDENMVN